MSSFHKDRPVIDDLPWANTDRLLLALALLPLGAMSAWLVLNWANTPERIPTHFGLGGSPDAWGDRSMLLLLPTIASVMTMLFIFSALLPHLANLPVRVTAETAPRIYVDIRRYVLVTCWLTNSLLSGLLAAVVQAAFGRSAGALLVGGLAAYVLMLFTTTVLAVRNMRRVAAAASEVSP